MPTAVRRSCRRSRERWSRRPDRRGLRLNQSKGRRVAPEGQAYVESSRLVDLYFPSQILQMLEYLLIRLKDIKMDNTNSFGINLVRVLK